MLTARRNHPSTTESLLLPVDSRFRGNDVPADGPGHPASGMWLSLNGSGNISRISVVVRHPVCRIPGGEVNRARKVYCARPLSQGHVAIPIIGVVHLHLPPRGSDVGKHAAYPYNSGEGPRSPHPPRGPFSTSANLYALPNSTALATPPGRVDVVPDVVGELTLTPSVGLDGVDLVVLSVEARVGDPMAVWCVGGFETSTDPHTLCRHHASKR